MNASLHRQLNRRKRRILRRIENQPGVERHQPMMTASNIRYEIADRSLHFFSQRLHRVAARLPDPHQREERDGKQHRHPSAVGKLQQVGG